MRKFTHFPKSRESLPEEYQLIFQREYLINRLGSSKANRIATVLEKWMHHRVALTSKKRGEDILEVGAGTLNHLHWEKNYQIYDIVEPSSFFIEAATNKSSVSKVYKSLAEIHREEKYDRIISIAVLEHMDDLPVEIARSALLLKENGIFCAAVPSEGSILWYLGWKYGTGIPFRLRTGLDYSVVMKYEHINNVNEIEKIIQWFYKEVKVVRFPLFFFHLSIYTVFIAQCVRRDHCLAEIG